MSVLIRLFFALTVTIVATFHVCGLATAQAYQPTALYAAADQDAAETADVVGEQCHICAVASLPGIHAVDAPVDLPVTGIAVAVRDLDSFRPRQTSPPPKA